MPDNFAYDVFLSHSAKDKKVVREIAEWLRKDGLKVWFDEWVLKPGDSIPAKIEEGLEQSRVLVLCMSAHAFGSDWAQLESGTFRFRDPLNKERRFIPLRLDEAPLKGSLAQFLYIPWGPADRKREYARLVEACRILLAENVAAGAVDGHGSLLPKYGLRVLRGHTSGVLAVALSNDDKFLVSGSRDKLIRIWDVASGICLRVLAGHDDMIRELQIDSKGNIYSASEDKTIRIWKLTTGELIAELKGHAAGVHGLAITPDEKTLVSASKDGTMRIWDLSQMTCRASIGYRKSWANAVVVTPDGKSVILGTEDGLITIWDLTSGVMTSILGKHHSWVWSLALTPDGNCLLSASGDSTVGVWDIQKGKPVAFFEGHKDKVSKVAIMRNSRWAVSGSLDKTVRIWDLKLGTCAKTMVNHQAAVECVAMSRDSKLLIAGYDGDFEMGNLRVWNLTNFISKAQEPVSELLTPGQVQYTNAKVLLVGESGVGKTGLSNYLAHGIQVEDDKPLPSTDGAWATHWPLKHEQKEDGVEREIWLWDFAGQVDYRLVHQLFMEDTAAAVLAFNPQKEDLFEGLGRWDRDLQKAARKPFAKLLAAARIDRGGLVVSAASMQKFMEERGFRGGLHETSAKTAAGCDELREAIVRAIDWDGIPKTNSPVLYHRLKQEILGLRDSGLVLIRMAELKQRLEMTLGETKFELAELNAVVSLLAGPGMIMRLDFGGFILLRPEVLSRYAAAAVRTVRRHPMELGCITEHAFLAGELDYQDFQRLPHEDEMVVLRALLETFINRAWCLRQPCENTALLTFPSYFRRERKEQPGHPHVLVTYRFDGPVDEIYATLVVQLHHTVAFDSTELWKAAADFKTQVGTKLGFTVTLEGEGTSRLEVYFEPDVDETSRVLFLSYVHAHLTQHGQNVKPLRHYCCNQTKCDSKGQQFTDQAMIDKALAPGGKGKVFCPDCGKPINLRDAVQQKFESPAIKEQVRVMQAESQQVIDGESKELILVGHAFSIVAEAGQIYRGYTNSDHGIDGEIEFKDDQGNASGKRLYVQLKSGDSYVKERKRDGVEVFKISNPRWADYWQQQAYPVMLVNRTSDGEIRWMDVTEFLKRQGAEGRSVKQVELTGERFDVMSVRRWRDKVLGKREG